MAFRSDLLSYVYANSALVGCLQPDEDDHVLNLQISWKGLVQPSRGQLLNGVSPEFEVALFTTVVLTSNERVTSTVAQVDEHHLQVAVCCHGRSIGTSYLKLLTTNNSPW
ncbi:hypothetical protein AAFF_G00041290 [Aldrovandia affinis]|uniref:Uridylate-specific endoribonuclease n=1 Tax=Aldrovandia affinis TaxID=143900 RepID=A0AAD7S2J8_9TELE|nr:hypothetical protein AAFF_G00041290 [Aldrovandia affinis]